MKKKKKLLAPIYENWLEFNENKPSRGIYEYPLFSDAYITGENTTDFGPYQFLNPCPPIHKVPKVQTALILRIDDRLNAEMPDMEKTDTTCYHGGDLIDEVAALLSLSLGVRIKAGGKIREFTPGGDKLGKPVAWEKRLIPNISIQYNHYKLPLAIGKHSITSLQPIKLFSKLSGENVITLIRAACHYQNSLWIAESEPSLAWIMLVSAIETAAYQWQKSDESTEEKLKVSKPKLYNYLKRTKVENITKKVAEYIANTLGATKKFIDFILEFLPQAPAERPDNYLQLSWEKRDIKKTINLIYQYRSDALHGGIPFPYPMCEAPYYSKNNAPAEKPIGLGAFANAGIWTIKDTPILLHTFEYITRNCLLNWWRLLNKNAN